jgi:hypothetical protein
MVAGVEVAIVIQRACKKIYRQVPEIHASQNGKNDVD